MTKELETALKDYFSYTTQTDNCSNCTHSIGRGNNLIHCTEMFKDNIEVNGDGHCILYKPLSK